MWLILVHFLFCFVVMIHLDGADFNDLGEFWMMC